ncbi:MAG TPA: hypothetical protein VFZ23_05795 [Pyrinomonadaceae bacterium]
MSAKVAAFIITLVLNIAIGVAVFFFLLLAMNGYSESDATYSFAAYIVLAVIVSLLMSSGAAIVAHVLLKRHFSGVVSVLIAVPIFVVAGLGLKIACSIIGVLVAEYVRLKY